MQRDRFDDLDELLAKARSLAGEMSRPTVRPAVMDRPCFLVGGADNDPEPLIRQIASAERLTFVVGAGASMEAGLPSWGGLVRSVLESLAPAALVDPVERAAWLDAAGEAGLLGMAAMARALAKSDQEFVSLVNEHLYRGKGPEHFDPGPLAREIAAWKRDFPEIELATFNYDQLLEQALTDLGLDGQPFENFDSSPSGVAAVRHLHGALKSSSEDAVVLTEGDYATWPKGTWQDLFMDYALDGVCVFVGLSFTDQNLLRWIYGAPGDRHVAVLARQGSPRLSAPVRRELEDATRARLLRANVTAYWADFFAEAAQFMHEARRRRLPGRPPSPYTERAQRRATKGRKRCLPAVGLLARQRKVRGILAESLSGVRAAIEPVGLEPADEVLGLGLWGLDYEQRDATLWGLSDRVHVDPSTVTSVPLEWDSEWVAIEAITQGSVVELDPDTYASRWRSARGIPLVWVGPEGRERIMVGAATLTSTKPPDESIFARAEEAAPGIRKTIDEALQEQLVRFWD